MAFVYWIKAPHHTDILTEGYVGITTNPVRIRFNGHKSVARKGGTLPIHYAIRKYAEQIEVKTIVDADVDYCRMLEERLRPEPSIAWNVCKGGQDTQKGRKCTPEQIERNRQIQLAIAKPPWKTVQGCQKTWAHAVILEENLKAGNSQAMVADYFGLLRATVHKVAKKIESGWSPGSDNDWLEHFKDCPALVLLDPAPPLDAWESGHANQDVWVLADLAFDKGLERGVEREFEREHCITRRGSSVMFRKIRSGWNPRLDENWLSFKENFKKEVWDVPPSA